MAIIEVQGLEHTYLADTPFASKVLHGVDLTVEEGELVGLIGPSRAGKSTVAQYLNGLLRPRRGRVVIDGVETASRSVDLRALRQNVGLVFQYPEHQLFAETVGEDVAFGPRNLGLPEDEVRRRVDAALETVSLEPAEFRDRYIHALSGGQMRRAAIAGVLALQPKVLILDDPIAGLDPRGRDDILGWIKQLHERENLTIVLISNSLEEIAPLLERVVVMSGGRVVASGAPGRVFADVDLMREVGLGLLPTVELMVKLRDKGYG
ncbi:MAG: ATP-binding cassette domain-containing protein, partial [Actinomycetota bacterium]